MAYISTLSKGIVLNISLHIALLFFVVSSGFYLSVTGFSVALVGVISFSGLYIGFKGLKFGWALGILSGAITCGLFLLFISQYEAMEKEINLYILATYCLVSFITPFLSSFVVNSNKDKK